MSANHTVRNQTVRSGVALLLVLAASSAAAQTSLVESVKADVIRRGVIPADQTTNCHAFEITVRVAFALRGEGALLFVKTPGQNGCTWTNGVRYSHDAIAFRSGGFVDMLHSAGPPDNTNGPTWDVYAGPPPTEAELKMLAAPFNPDAVIVIPPPVDPPPPPPPPPPPDPLPEGGIQASLLRIQAQLDALKVDVAAVSTSLDEHRRSWQRVLVRLTKYLGPAAAALIAGWQVGS